MTYCTFGLKPCETKRPMPGTIKHMATRSLLHNTHLPLAELHTTHSQTNLHTSGVAGTLGHTVWSLSADCGQSYQPLRPQSPRNKGKEKKRTYCTISMALLTTTCILTWTEAKTHLYDRHNLHYRSSSETLTMKFKDGQSICSRQQGYEMRHKQTKIHKYTVTVTNKYYKLWFWFLSNLSTTQII